MPDYAWVTKITSGFKALATACNFDKPLWKDVALQSARINKMEKQFHAVGEAWKTMLAMNIAIMCLIILKRLGRTMSLLRCPLLQLLECSI